MSKIFENFPVILLIFAIAFSPSFSVGKIISERSTRIIEIRTEDILIAILGLIWIINFLIEGKRKVKKPPLIFPILAWLTIGFFSLLTNWILMNIELSRGLFYFLKEIEFFFLYFYFFYHIKNLDSAKFIIKIWIALGLANVILIFFELLKKIGSGTYGPTMFMEKGPLPSGGFFLILFANLFNIFLYYYSSLNISKIKKIILTLFILSLSAGVVSSNSRTAIFGLFLVIILSLFLYQLKRGGLKPFFIGLIIFFIVSVIFLYVSGKLFRLRPLDQPVTALGPRIEIWKSQIELLPDNLFYILFGMGKSVLLVGEESHSQYIRNFIETGLMGSLIFLFLIFSIIKKSWQGFSFRKDPFSVGLAGGLLISTITMLFISIAAEGFLVVKPNEAYWSFVGLAMAVLTINKE